MIDASITGSELWHVFSQVLTNDIDTYKNIGYTITKKDKLKVSSPMYFYRSICHVLEELGIKIIEDEEIKIIEGEEK